MKTAQNWQTELAGETSLESICAIQVDALLQAARLCRLDNGLSILAARKIETLASEVILESVQPNTPAHARREEPRT